MKEEPTRVILDISWTALFKVLGLVMGVLLILLLQDILMMLLAVFIFVAAINPTVARLENYMSRFLAVGVVYVLILLTGVVISYAILPTLIQQTNDLVKALPEMVTAARSLFDSFQSGRSNIFDQALGSISGNLEQFTRHILETTLGFFGGIATFLTGLVLGFYLLLEEKRARDFINQLLPQPQFMVVYATIHKISTRMGNWVSGQLLLMLIIGFANLVAYYLIGLPSPLALGVWAGLMEIIPYLGPLLGVIPAVIVAIATGSILQAVLTFLIGFVLIQQLEANLVVPKVMGKAVGLSPVLVILALLIGLKLFGLLGAIISLPVAAIISVIVGEWPSLRKIWSVSE